MQQPLSYDVWEMQEENICGTCDNVGLRISHAKEADFRKKGVEEAYWGPVEM